MEQPHFITDFTSCVIISTVQEISFLLPNSDVENIGADRGGYGHVAEALPRDDDARDEVGDGGAGRQEGQPHHLLRKVTSVSHANLNFGLNALAGKRLK